MMTNPMTDSAIQDAIYEILNHRDWNDKLSGLRPTDTITVDISHDDFIDLYLQRQGDFMTIFRNAVFRILQQRFVGIDIPTAFSDLKIKLTSGDVINMREINSKKEGETICFEATVIATDAPKTYIKSADVECGKCFTKEHVTCGFDRTMPVLFCMNSGCGRSKMDVTKKGILTDDIQTILLQQPLENADNNSPILFYGKLIGDNVGTSFIGQRKRIVGIFRSVIKPKDEEHEVIIDILSINDMDDNRDILPTAIERDMLLKESKDKDFVEKLIHSYAPDIFGYDDIKLSCLLQLVGGVKTKKRGDINILLVGDPSMAKSELLKYGKSITQKSVYTSGRGSTSAGLTIGMVKLSDGRMVAQAGVLPLCSGGYAFIDEFDKMGKDDRSSMHEAMEQQTVSIAKAGISLTLDAKTSIMAAANPKFGNYDPDLSLMDNINIPSPLLSRFDLIWLIRDSVNITEDLLKANHILDGFDETEQSKQCRFSEDELTAFINEAKKCTPKITKEVRDEIVKIYEKLRQSSDKELNIGIRQLEAMIRLSMAHAKLRFRETVQVDDILAVKGLLVKMFDNFDINILKGNQQQSTLIGSSGRMSKQQLHLHIWDQCKDKEGCVKMNEFFKRLEAEGIDELERQKIFGNWEKTNQIKVMANGTWKRT
jgi:replicative DNA helicase Mcm